MGYQRNAIESCHKPEVRLAGGFRTNAGASPTTAMLYGNFIESVARTGAGTYTVTLKPEWRNRRAVSMRADIQLAAGGDSKAQLGAYVASAGTLVVRTITTAAAADIAADPDNKVWFELVLLNNDAPVGSPAYET